MNNIDSRPHALYRFYGDDGALLYVGITANPAARFPQHAQDKPWWHEVRGISMEPYPDRASAIAAETRAIEVEHPRHNIQRPSLPNKRAQRTSRTAAPTQLIWVCDTCREPVADDQGYIHVDLDEIEAHRTAARAWRAHNPGPMISGGAILDYPTAVHWGIHHGACDPNPDSNDYHFDVARCRTHADLLGHTAHLMSKRWIHDTDWDELIERMARVST